MLIVLQEESRGDDSMHYDERDINVHADKETTLKANRHDGVELLAPQNRLSCEDGEKNPVKNANTVGTEMDNKTSRRGYGPRKKRVINESTNIQQLKKRNSELKARERMLKRQQTSEEKWLKENEKLTQRIKELEDKKRKRRSGKWRAIFLSRIF